MGKVTKDPTIEIDGIELPINTLEDSGCFVKILLTCKNQIDSMLTYHSRVFTYRFDLHQKHATGDNSILSLFIRKVRKKIESIYKLKRVGFIWCREQHDAETQHYHLILLLDGDKVQRPKRLAQILTKTAKQVEMTVGYCERPYTLLNRKDLKKYKALFYRLSYFAKERGKENWKRNKTANRFSASRLKPNLDNEWQGRLEDFSVNH